MLAKSVGPREGADEGTGRPQRRNLTQVDWGGRAVRLLAPILFIILIWLGSIRPASASAPISLLVTNARDTLFTVSWLTPAEETGHVQLVGGKTYEDARGPNFKGTTHYVPITGLAPTTAYSFDVVSGGNKYDSGGDHWSVTTGATLPPPVPDLIVGRVKESDGSAASDAIVLFTVQKEQEISAPLSMLLTPADKGFFHVNLSDARPSNDLSRYFEYSTQGDLLTIQAANARGQGLVKVGTGDPRLRASDPNQTLIIELQAPGQTPTIVVRQPTPTPIPAAPSADTSGAWVGLGAVAIIGIGILVAAVVFVWRR